MSIVDERDYDRAVGITDRHRLWLCDHEYGSTNDHQAKLISDQLRQPRAPMPQRACVREETDLESFRQHRRPCSACLHSVDDIRSSL